MAEHVWTVLCYKVLLDPDSDKVSLIDVTERLTLRAKEQGFVEKKLATEKAQGSPGFLIPASLSLISSWTRSDQSIPENSRFRYAITNPLDVRIHEEVYALNLHDFSSQRIVIRFQEIPVSALGRHWFVIEHERPQKNRMRWISVARLPFDLIESTSPVD